MTTFTLSIRMGNETMQSKLDIADALRKVAARIEYDLNDYDGFVMDTNGNKIGDWKITR